MLLLACPLSAAVAQPAAPLTTVAQRSTEAMQTTASPGSPQATNLAPQRNEARKSLNERGWKTYRDNRYAFRYPAGLVTASHPNGAVELDSLDQEFHMRASSRINSEKETVQSAWQQRLEEHGQSVTYKRKGDGWFVMTGVEDGKTYYRKHFVNPQRTAEFVITYPKSRASVYDPWVIDIEKSFVAHRVSDSAHASSSTEPPSVVTRAPAVGETLELPTVIGRSYDDAANVLTAFKVERVEVASAAPTGEVLAQDPAQGSSLLPGSAIALRVSDGSLASAAAAVPAPSAASVAPASQLETSTAPVQNDGVAGAFIGEIPSNVVAAPVAGVLLGLLLGSVLMRLALLARSRAIDTAPAEHVDIAPAEIDSSQAAAGVHRVEAIAPPPEIKFTARLDPGQATIKFTDLPQDEEAAIAGRETTGNT